MSRLILYSKFSADTSLLVEVPMSFVGVAINKSVKSAKSASKNQPLYICQKTSTNPPFFEKTKPIFPPFQPKNRDLPKPKPIQSQSKPIQTQFFGLKMNNLVYPVIFSKNTVLICVTCPELRRRNQCLNIIRVNSTSASSAEPWNLLLKAIPFYAKRTQTSLFPDQKQRFHPKTNPKQTQTKPNCKTAKMNLYPLLSKRYEKIRLFDRNENKPKSNPKQTHFGG